MAKKKPIEVPVCYSGLISELTEISFCMDRATHLLQNVGIRVRLAPRNKQVESALKNAAGRRTNYTVCGYLVRGPECDYLSAYSVEPVLGLKKRLDSLGPSLQVFTGAR